MQRIGKAMSKKVSTTIDEATHDLINKLALHHRVKPSEVIRYLLIQGTEELEKLYNQELEDMQRPLR